MGRGLVIEADRPLSPIDVIIQRCLDVAARFCLNSREGPRSRPRVRELFTDRVESSVGAEPRKGRSSRCVREIRIGIVGAGQIARARHLPGFLGLPGVRVVGVCNLRRETAARVAREFDIPKVYGAWEDLVEDDTVDAVVIGAWPNLHCPVTLAALDAGKHVLTAGPDGHERPRGAADVRPRRASRPKLTAMIVPSPYGLAGDAYMRSLIAARLPRARCARSTSTASRASLADPKTPLGWRQMTKYSGFNMLTLGILYETVLRWAPPATRVLAYASKADPAPPRPRVGQAGPRRHARQRAGADGPGRRLVRDLPPQRRGLARTPAWASRSTAARGRSPTT